MPADTMISREPMRNIYKVVAQVRRVLGWVAVLWLVACSPSRAVTRYVLIAPFEGKSVK
jgi:hypothetical protein